MNGFLIIDKPPALTSFDVIRKIKKLFPKKTKLGHLGTLDPMARGVLPVAIGSATRLIQYLGDETKEYLAEMTLGGRSDTQDAWGDISYTEQSAFDINDLELILKSFQGKINQVPPMYSAVHHEGKRLYELARQGISVERKAREVEISSVELLGVDSSLELPRIKIRIVCSRGTYVRTLCHDIGEQLGTGAFLSALLRVRSGLFTIKDSYSIEDIQDKKSNLQELLLPVDYPLAHLETVEISSREQTVSVLNGNRIVIDARTSTGLVRVYSSEQQLIAIADSEAKGEKTIIKPVKVFK